MTRSNRSIVAMLACAALLTACAAPVKKPPPNITTQLATEGYRRVVMDGREMYCRPDEVLGSRVARGEICRTAAELENSRRNSEEFIRGINNSGVGGQSSNQPTAPR